MLICWPGGADLMLIALVLDINDLEGAVIELPGDLNLPIDLSRRWSLPLLIKY